MAYTLEWVNERLEESMPSLSPTTSKVMQLANDINCPPAELTRVIKMDPVLSAKVLRLVNSSYFSLSTKIVSLEKAVILMGLNTVKNLALSTAVLAQMESGQTQDDPIAGVDFWKHSLAVGIVAKNIALQRGIARKDAEDYFLAGMLHKLGLMAESRLFPEQMLGVLLQAGDGGLLAAENGVLEGINHCRVGGVLAARWSLSPDLTDVMTNYAQPVTGDGARELTLSVHVASVLCRNREIGQILDPVPVAMAEGVVEQLGLAGTFADAAMENLDQEMAKAVEFLKA